MTWYHNNTRGEKPQGATEKAKHTGKGVKSFKKNYTAKGVAKDHFKDLILEHIQNLTDAKPGSCKGTTRSPCTTTFILITSSFSAIISNLPRCLSSSRDLSQTIATIADHRTRPHSLAQPRTASPGLSQRPSKYGRLGTVYGHLYIHTSR